VGGGKTYGGGFQEAWGTMKCRGSQGEGTGAQKSKRPKRQRRKRMVSSNSEKVIGEWEDEFWEIG